ncbi:MAG TPA: DUF4193 family protein [Acidimicrobiales bacterium]
MKEEDEGLELGDAEEPQDFELDDELDEDDLDEDALSEDALSEDDLDEGDLDEDNLEENAVAVDAEAPKVEATDEAEDDEDEEDDEVEASLDVILQERLRTAEADGDDAGGEEEEEEPVLGGDLATVIPVRRPEEFLCRSCFLLKPPTQLADVDHQLCRDCA